MKSSSKPSYGLNSRILFEKKTVFLIFVKLFMQYCLEENQKHFNYNQDEFAFRNIIKKYRPPSSRPEQDDYIDNILEKKSKTANHIVNKKINNTI